MKESICVITYNHAPYIRRCIDSLLMQQTDFPYEIIVNDDCSTDGTADILREYETGHPSIVKPVFHEENQVQKGVYTIFSTFVFPKAQGRYIAICEGDDYWTDPLKLQKQVDFMDSHPDCSMSFHAVRISHADGTYVDEHRYEGDRGECPVEDILEHGFGFCKLCTVMLSRELFGQGHASWVNGVFLEDGPIELHGFVAGKVGYIDEVMSVYDIMLPGSWSSSAAASIRVSTGVFLNEIMIYKAFDRRTERRYHRCISKRIWNVRLNVVKAALKCIIRYFTGRG